VAAPLREVLVVRAALSVIVPTLNEERSIARLLDDVSMLEVPHEVIVVDGGSTDDTAGVAARHGARVLRARRGRGAQLAAGARAGSAPVLCFLHADVRLRADARRELAELARARPAGAFAFRFRIDARGWRYRLIEFGARQRMRLFGLPYGDQGLVVSRTDYELAGGYPDVPLMEDVALVDALRGITTVRSLRSELPISARRWNQEGPFTRTLRNWRIMVAYRSGASPHRLASRYRPHGDSPDVDAAVLPP
jgi:rSAM/selenodomain-associated transferase 2